MRRLKEHGYGLLVANEAGDVDLRVAGVPLIQLILNSEYREEVKGLRGKLGRKVAQAFDAYQHRPPLGVTEISEVAEGMVLKAGREAVGRGWLGPGQIGTPASTLDALSECKTCQNARAALGGMRSFISEYRNVSHHFPKDKKKAYVEYRECKHAFVDGIKHIKRFRGAMRNLGLSGNLP